MDLGECPKYHDVALRADFEAASKKKDYFYDIDVSARKHHLHFLSYTLVLGNDKALVLTNTIDHIYF